MSSVRKLRPAAPSAEALVESLDAMAYKLEQRAGLRVEPITPERATEWAQLCRRVIAHLVEESAASARFQRPRGLRAGRR